MAIPTVIGQSDRTTRRGRDSRPIRFVRTRRPPSGPGRWPGSVAPSLPGCVAKRSRRSSADVARYRRPGAAAAGRRGPNCAESSMSGASVDDYHPGLEGVIASETAIANIEGQGRGGRPGISRLPDRGPRRRGRLRGDGVPAAARRPAQSRSAPRVRRPAPATRGRSPSRWSSLLRQIPAAIHPWTCCGRRSASCRISTPTSTRRPPTTPPTSARPSA